MNGPAVGPPSPEGLATGGLAQSLLGLWIAATFGGAIIGLVGTALLAIGLIYTRSLGSINFEAALPTYGVIVGLGIGGLQGRVLGSVLPPNIWRQWTVVTVAGVTAALIAVRFTWPAIESVYNSLGSLGSGSPFVISEGVSAFIALLAVCLVCAALGGLILGCAQWLVLRRYVGRAAWWIPGNMAAVAAALTSTIFIVWVLTSIGRYDGLRVVYMFVGGAACIPWPVIAGVTGWTLVELLKRPGKSSVTKSSVTISSN